MLHFPTPPYIFLNEDEHSFFQKQQRTKRDSIYCSQVQRLKNAKRNCLKSNQLDNDLCVDLAEQHEIDDLQHLECPVHKPLHFKYRFHPCSISSTHFRRKNLRTQESRSWH